VFKSQEVQHLHEANWLSMSSAEAHLPSQNSIALYSFKLPPSIKVCVPLFEELLAIWRRRYDKCGCSSVDILFSSASSITLWVCHSDDSDDAWIRGGGKDAKWFIENAVACKLVSSLWRSSLFAVAVEEMKETTNIMLDVFKLSAHSIMFQWNCRANRASSKATRLFLME